MRVAVTVTMLLACAMCPPALAAWSGFTQPSAGLCTFGSPQSHAALVISGRFQTGQGRARPVYSLVFSANDGGPEITALEVAIDEQKIADFQEVGHVPAASGASAVVPLTTETLGALFHATDSGTVLRIRTLPVRSAFDFELTGFATAADVFASCMLRVGQ